MNISRFFLCAAFALLSANPVFSLEKASLKFPEAYAFLGDTLRFDVEVTDAGGEVSTSKMAVIEILAPEGYVVEKRKYELKRGHCEARIALRPLLLSGLYEVRAYTPRMLVDGKNNYASQVLPFYGGNRDCPTILNRRLRKGKDVDTSSISKDWATIDGYITVRGRLERKVKKFLRAPRYVAVPHAEVIGTLPIGDSEKQATCMTDDDGWFNIKLPKFYGRKMLTLLYAGLEDNRNVRFRIERLPQPQPREFTEAEKNLLYANHATVIDPKTIGAKDKDWRPLIHSVVHFDVDEIYMNLRQAEEYDSPVTGLFITDHILLDQFPEYMSEKIDGLRFAILDDDYPADDAVPEARLVKDVQAFMPSLYREIVFRTDSAICERYRYGSPSLRNPVQPHDRYQKTFAFCKNSKGSTEPTGRPSLIVCVVPKKPSEKPSEMIEHGARFVVHGLSR